MVHVRVRLLPLYCTLDVPAHEPGMSPHMATLFDTTKRVSAVMPCGQLAGMVPDSWLLPKFRFIRLCRALYDGGSVPTRALDCNCSSVSVVRSE